LNLSKQGRAPRQVDLAALDACADQFVSTFVSHVAAMIGHGEQRIATILEIEGLVIAALTNSGRPDSSSWRILHQTIIDIVETRADTLNERSAQYLRSFMRENDDLAG
jgi:hypothetical protein